MTQRKLDDDLIQRLRAAKDAVININWTLTSEGPDFWEDVYSRIRNKAHYGTTDGKPWIEPELTDEDARARPWVMIRNGENIPWTGPATLVDCLQGDKSRFLVVWPDKKSWSSCMFARLATPAEIEAANVRR